MPVRRSKTGQLAQDTGGETTEMHYRASQCSMNRGQSLKRDIGQESDSGQPDFLFTSPRATSLLLAGSASSHLNTKLPQMMIQMLVHQSCPLLRRELSEEGVRILGTAPRPGLGKPVDQCGQLRAFLP
jgi:hypothetical protein